MAVFATTTVQIEKAMTGEFDGKTAVLPSPVVQNHAAFLAHNPQGDLECVWFAGSLEGKSDICIYSSTLIDQRWSTAVALTQDVNRSEQNPILFYPDKYSKVLIHTAQPGGNQDQCRVLMHEIDKTPVELLLPKGTFVRAVPWIRKDGAWLLPLFHCVAQEGAKWTGRHDTASVAISVDKGANWRLVAVPDSIGCVHMTILPGKKEGQLSAYFRRRQADFIYRSHSMDDGESWSAPVATVIPNNNSSIAAIRLRDNRVAICCNPINKYMSAQRRVSLYDELGDDDTALASGGCDSTWGVPRAPLVVLISDDDGQSFSQCINVADSSGQCLSNNSIDDKNQELSYPAIIETADGGIDVAFTLHRRAIAHVRLSPANITANK